MYVVDFDLPFRKGDKKNESKRVMFYYKVHQMFREHFGKDMDLSTYSCYASDNEQVAKAFYEIAKEHCSRATLYKAVALSRFGKGEKQ